MNCCMDSGCSERYLKKKADIWTYGRIYVQIQKPEGIDELTISFAWYVNAWTLDTGALRLHTIAKLGSKFYTSRPSGSRLDHISVSQSVLKLTTFRPLYLYNCLNVVSWNFGLLHLLMERSKLKLRKRGVDL